ncbi:MAG: PEP-CTERM sorting domain-containing protein [Sphingomicrobium sp.]
MSFIDGINSLGRVNAADQILLIEFQPTTLAGNTLGSIPLQSVQFIRQYSMRVPARLPIGQNTLDAWLSMFAALGSEQLQGNWIAEGLTATNTGAESLTINSLDVAATPLPATLPLFAGGLGALGYFGIRRKRKVPVD